MAAFYNMKAIDERILKAHKVVIRDGKPLDMPAMDIWDLRNKIFQTIGELYHRTNTPNNPSKGKLLADMALLSTLAGKLEEQLKGKGKEKGKENASGTK